MPIGKADTPDAFRDRAAEWREPRNQPLWDANMLASKAFAAVLGIASPAWDAFLIYGRDVRWTADAPPAPTRWLHQLRLRPGVREEQRFEPGRFAAEVQALLDEPLQDLQER